VQPFKKNRPSIVGPGRQAQALSLNANSLVMSGLA